MALTAATFSPYLANTLEEQIPWLSPAGTPWPDPGLGEATHWHHGRSSVAVTNLQTWPPSAAVPIPQHKPYQ